MKNINPNHLKYAFALVAILELAAHLFDIQELSKFTKPLLMPLLLIYFRNSMSGPVTSSFLLALFALVFSWVGDLLLMYQNYRAYYFIGGLGAFSIAQILYIISFAKARKEGTSWPSIMTKILYSLPFIFFGLVFLYYILPNAESLQIPVIVYASLLVLMVIMAALRVNSTSQKSHNQVFFGALLFLFSDSLIALNKFLFPMDMPNLFIMFTYILAQWNIVEGLLIHYNEE